MARGASASTGKCLLCGASFGKLGITRHLQACAGAAAPAAGAFHLVVEGAYAPQYWMHLLVSSRASLANLDAFLRKTWLECCGHLSAFTIEGIRYTDPRGRDDFWGLGEPERNISTRLAKVLKPGLELSYEYDFGSTTDLRLRVVGETGLPASGEKVTVLARNDAPQIACEECGNPATRVCSQCIYEGVGWLCDDCIVEHECGREMSLPVVNSPRVGVCGYTGGEWS
jgi:hypothetical protein